MAREPGGPLLQTRPKCQGSCRAKHTRYARDLPLRSEDADNRMLSGDLAIPTAFRTGLRCGAHS